MSATFHFLLRKDRPNKRGLCPVYFMIIHNRKKKYLNTGIWIEAKYWNPDRQEVRRSHRNSNMFNQDLGRIRGNGESAYRELHREKRVSADAIKKRLEYASKDNFFTLADEYLEEIKVESFWTHKQTKVAIEKLKEFHGSEHLPVNLIDSDFLTRFQSQLKKKNKASTIIKNFGCIKNILNLAVRKHLLPSNPMLAENFKLVKSNGSGAKTKLSLDQITAIEHLDLKVDTNTWHSRNAFILAFSFCGMRFGDVAELRWSNLKNDRLSYEMNKTSNPINIQIKGGAKRILGLYKIESDKDYVFPFLADLTSEQQNDPGTIRKRISSWNSIVNGCLGEIANQAEIDEKISMHVARHSFAQYGVNDRNIPPYKMMMLLGHKNIQTTMQYLKSLDLKTVDTVMDEIF